LRNAKDTSNEFSAEARGKCNDSLALSSRKVHSHSAKTYFGNNW